MSRKNYWNVLTQDIFANKTLVFLVILVTVLCFGFTVTNFSIGVDDPARDYYLYSNSVGTMIQQGRLMHVAFNYLTHTVRFIPFFTDFVGASLYALSALLFCALFQYVSDNRFGTAALAAFCTVYISNSVIAEKYIYHLDVIVTILSYCLCALALMYAYRFVKEKKGSMFLLSCVSLMGALGSYESFGFVYFCGVFAIFILEIIVKKEYWTFWSILCDGLKYALVLCVSMIAYYALVELMQMITHQNDIFIRYNFWADSGEGIVKTFLMATENIVRYFLDSIQSRYMPVLVFGMLSAVGFALFAFLTVRLKNPWLVLCYCALWLGNFLIHYANGNFIARGAQTFCLFTGFVILILVDVTLCRNVLKQIVCCLVTLLVFVQSADMNRWFYNDYVRYQKESFVIHSVATRLVAECDLSKSVVFTNNPDFRYFDTQMYPGRQVNGNSVLYWSVYAWEDPTQPFVTELFRMHGYDFVRSPDEEQFAQAHIAAESMPSWPQEGYLQEFDDFIVVNFG